MRNAAAHTLLFIHLPPPPALSSGVVFPTRLVSVLAYRLSPLKTIPRGLKRDGEIADTYTRAVSVE